MAKHRKILLNCSRRMLRNPGVSPPAARSMVFHRLEDRKLLSGTASDPQAAHDLFNLSPALFVENQGQWEESSVRYAFQRPGANILFTDEGPVFELYRAINAPERSGSDGRFERDPLADRRAEPVEIEALRFQTLFEGANAVRPVALNQAETVINYFVGDESEWRADVPTYTTIVYFGLWEGIDLYLSGQQGSLKYEFHVAPEADWRAIRVEWEGIEGMSLSEDGDLIIDTPLGTISDSAPVLWQVIDGANAPVGGQYRLLDERTYGFEVTSPYDAQRALVIDPEVEWMMYLGGSSSERAMSVAADRHNSMLITGYTFSADFSGRNNSYYGGFQQSDAFVAKLSHTGTLLWMLYLGGTSADYGRGISVDSSGNAFLTGTTLSSDFVGRNNAYSGSYEDAFVAKVSTAGSVLWMTYLQGAPGTNDNYGISIAADALGHSFTTGYENTQNGAAAFITKVSPGGIAQWTTYLGGSDEDFGWSIALDGLGNALVTGETYSADFVGRNNSIIGRGCGFVVKVNERGVLEWMTYVGGSNWDFGYGIAVDAQGDAFITGATESLDLVERRNSFHGGDGDGFVARIEPNGNVMWMVYIGGSGHDWGRAIAAQDDGTVVVTGQTNSPDFEGRRNGLYGSADNSDAFIASIGREGSLQWMAYLGGADWDSGNGVAIDATGTVLVAGLTRSHDFVGRRNGFHGGPDQVLDAFVLRLLPPAPPPPVRITQLTSTYGISRDTNRDSVNDQFGRYLSGFSITETFVATFQGSGFTEVWFTIGNVTQKDLSSQGGWSVQFTTIGDLTQNTSIRVEARSGNQVFATHTGNIEVARPTSLVDVPGNVDVTGVWSASQRAYLVDRTAISEPIGLTVLDAWRDWGLGGFVGFKPFMTASYVIPIDSSRSPTVSGGTFGIEFVAFDQTIYETSAPILAGGMIGRWSHTFSNSIWRLEVFAETSLTMRSDLSLTHEWTLGIEAELHRLSWSGEGPIVVIPIINLPVYTEWEIGFGGSADFTLRSRWESSRYSLMSADAGFALALSPAAEITTGIRGIIEGGLRVEGEFELGVDYSFSSGPPPRSETRWPASVDLEILFVGSILDGRLWRGEWSVWEYVWYGDMFGWRGPEGGQQVGEPEPFVNDLHVGWPNSGQGDHVSSVRLARSAGDALGLAYVETSDGGRLSTIVYQERASGAGTWGASRTVLSDDKPKFGVAVDFMPDGRPMIIYAGSKLRYDQFEGLSFEEGMASVELYWTRWTGNAWTTPVAITNDQSLDGDVQLRLAPAGQSGLLVWTRDPSNGGEPRDASEIYFSVWNGASWSSSRRLTNNATADALPVVEYSADGSRAIVAWIGPSGPLSAVMSAVWNGSQMSTPAPIVVARENEEFREVVLQVLEDGRMSAVWSVSGLNGTRIEAVRSQPDWTGWAAIGTTGVVRSSAAGVGGLSVTRDQSRIAVGFHQIAPDLTDVFVSVLDLDVNADWTLPLRVGGGGWAGKHAAIAYRHDAKLTVVYAPRQLAENSSPNAPVFGLDAGLPAELMGTTIAPKPDLRIDAGDLVVVNPMAEPGQQTQVLVTVHNGGLSGTGNGFWIALYNNDPSGGGQPVHEQFVSGLNMGVSATVTIGWVVPSDTWQLYAVVDSRRTIDELIETNNATSTGNTRHRGGGASVVADDSDGDQVTFKVTGRDASVWYTTALDGSIATVYVRGDDLSRSALSAVIRTGGDGSVAIQSVEARSNLGSVPVALKSINMRGVNLVGSGIALNGVQKATFGDFLNGAELCGSVTQLTVGLVDTNGAFVFDGHLSRFTASSIVAIEGLTAGSIGTFIVTGEADVQLATTEPITIASIQIKGLGESRLRLATGAINKFNIFGNLTLIPGSVIDGELKNWRVRGDLVAGDLVVSGNTSKWRVDGDVAADASVALTGGNVSIFGDVMGQLDLSAPTRVDVRGAMVGASLSIADATLSRLRVRQDIRDGAEVSAIGDLREFRVDAAMYDGTAVHVDGNLERFTGNSDIDGVVSASHIETLSIKGSMDGEMDVESLGRATIRGDFSGSVSATTETGRAITRFDILGVASGRIDALGDVDELLVGEMRQMEVYLGLRNWGGGLPGRFDRMGTVLGRLQVRGATTGATIAAPTVSRLDLRDVLPEQVFHLTAIEVDSASLRINGQQYRFEDDTFFEDAPNVPWLDLVRVLN